MIQLPDPAEEAQRLLNDPDHLRRKADYIESQIRAGSPHNETRRLAVAKLLADADRLEKVS